MTQSNKSVSFRKTSEKGDSVSIDFPILFRPCR